MSKINSKEKEDKQYPNNEQIWNLKNNNIESKGRGSNAGFTNYIINTEKLDELLKIYKIIQNQIMNQMLI